MAASVERWRQPNIGRRIERVRRTGFIQPVNQALPSAAFQRDKRGEEGSDYVSPASMRWADVSTFPGAGNGMSAMRVLRFASAARAGSGIEAVPLATDEVRVDVFGRRPGAPCSDTANTSVPWEESLQDTTRLYPSPGDCLGS